MIIHKTCGLNSYNYGCHDALLTLINADKDPHKERFEGERASFA